MNVIITLFVAAAAIALLQNPSIDPSTSLTALTFLFSIVLSSRTLLYIARSSKSKIVYSSSFLALLILPFSLIMSNLTRMKRISMPEGVVNGTSSSHILTLFTVAVFIPILPMILSLIIPKKDNTSTKTEGTIMKALRVIILIILSGLYGLFFYCGIVMPRTSYPPFALDMVFANSQVSFAQAAIPMACLIALLSKSRITGWLAFLSVLLFQMAWITDIQALAGAQSSLEGLPGLNTPDIGLFSLNTRMFGPRSFSGEVTLLRDQQWYAGALPGGREVVLTADVYLPLGVEPNGGVFIKTHGGGFVIGGKGKFNQPWFSASLASMGFIVIDPNYGLVKNITSIGPMQVVPSGLWDARRWHSSVDDCGRNMETLLGWVETQVSRNTWNIPEGVEPAIVVGGGSAGAGMASLLAQRHPTRVSGLIVESLCNNVDPANKLNTTDPFYLPLTRPSVTVHAAQTPTLQIHGTNDPICSCSESMFFGDLSRASGVKYGSMEVATGGHILTFDTTASALVWLELCAQFMTNIVHGSWTNK